MKTHTLIHLEPDGQKVAPLPLCRHRGEKVGEAACPSCNGKPGTQRVNVFACEKHGTAHLWPKPLADRARPCVDCKDGPLQIAGRGGIGDHIYTLMCAQAKRDDGFDVTLCVDLEFQYCAEWVSLFEGWRHPQIGTASTAPVLTPYQGTGTPAESASVQRWKVYGKVCGVEMATPRLAPLPADVRTWAEPYRGGVLLCPWVNNDPGRQWSTLRWLMLEQRLTRAGFRPVVIDKNWWRTPEEETRNELFRCPVIRESARHVAALMLESSLVIGQDSGMSHIAGVLGARALALCDNRPGENIYGCYPSVSVLQASFPQLQPDRVVNEVRRMLPLNPKVTSNSLLPEDRLRWLARTVRETACIPGDLAELGVYRGGSALQIATASDGRVLHLFDTFKGLPADDSQGPHRKGEFAANMQDVALLLAAHNAEGHPGVFPSTAPDDLRFSCVHIDADLYESTRDALAYFWPRLSPGGYLVLDDWKWPQCPGVERAVREAGLLPLVEETAPCQCRIRKPL